MSYRFSTATITVGMTTAINDANRAILVRFSRNMAASAAPPTMTDAALTPLGG